MYVGTAEQKLLGWDAVLCKGTEVLCHLSLVTFMGKNLHGRQLSNCVRNQAWRYALEAAAIAQSVTGLRITGWSMAVPNKSRYLWMVELGLYTLFRILKLNQHFPLSVKTPRPSFGLFGQTQALRAWILYWLIMTRCAHYLAAQGTQLIICACVPPGSIRTRPQLT